MSKQLGYTLVEVLIASMLGLLLSASVLSALYASGQSNNQKTAMEEVQENASLAHHFFKQDIQSLGYLGCYLKPAKDIVINSRGEVAQQLVQKGLIDINQFSYKNSDSLSFVAKSGEGADVINSMRYVHSELDLVAGTSFDDGQELLVTDCENAELIKITSQWNNRIAHEFADNKSGNLASKYPRGSHVYPLSLIHYKIAKGAGSQSGLFRKKGESYFQELVPGVIDLSARYVFRDTKSQAISYLTEISSTGNKQLIGIDIKLLFSSTKEVMANHMLLKELDGSEYHATDRRFYKRYQFTFALAK